MSGIMAAIAGNAQNIIYAAGLYVVETAVVQQSPITASVTTSFQNITITRNWIGYFLSDVTATVQLGVQVTANPGFGGGSATTTGRLWLGDNAVAGNNAAADITISQSSGTETSNANFNLVQGVYTPLRIRWNGSYFPEDFSDVSGSITFLASGSNNVLGKIFYNTSTNGF